jgi:hypothetical protein
VSRDLSDVMAGLGAAGLDEEERVTEARERLKHEVTEFTTSDDGAQPAGEDGSEVT